MRKALDLIGQRVDKVLVIRPIRDKDGEHAWLCRCDCGEEVVREAYYLKMMLLGKRKTGCKSCYGKSISEAGTEHGDTNGKYRRIHQSWTNMKSRCLNPKNQDYRWYGARGIKICEAWTKYIPFREWALASGYKENLVIDRINPDVGYEPGNCRWVTASQNSKRMAWKKVVLKVEAENITLRKALKECRKRLEH